MTRLEEVVKETVARLGNRGTVADRNNPVVVFVERNPYVVATKLKLAGFDATSGRHQELAGVRVYRKGDFPLAVAFMARRARVRGQDARFIWIGGQA